MRSSIARDKWDNEQRASEQAETNGHYMQPNSDKKQSMDSSSELLKHESLDQGQKKFSFGASNSSTKSKQSPS